MYDSKPWQKVRVDMGQTPSCIWNAIFRNEGLSIKSSLTKDKRFQLATRNILSENAIEIIDILARCNTIRCQMPTTINVRYLTRYICHKMSAIQSKINFQYVDLTIRYISDSRYTYNCHVFKRKWYIYIYIYMTCSRYTWNCQVLKCHIHDMKLSGIEMSHTQPVAGIHETVRYWGMAGITGSLFSGPLTYVLHLFTGLRYHAANPCSVYS